ncbi:MAG: hypothetical protein ACP5UT_13005 [Bryobacteraceae bacterium]
MTLLPLLFALTAPPQPAVQVIFNDTVDIAPGQVRTLAIPIRNAPRRVACVWLVHRGEAARLVLLPAAEVDAWLQGKPHSVVAQTDFARSGAVSSVAAAPAELVLVLETRGSRRPVRLRLLVRLMDPALPIPDRPLAADRRRGEMLVWGSFGLFSAVAAFSATRLRRNFRRRRWRAQPWA